jgi:hypothetical protein
MISQVQTNKASMLDDGIMFEATSTTSAGDPADVVFLILLL